VRIEDRHVEMLWWIKQNPDKAHTRTPAVKELVEAGFVKEYGTSTSGSVMLTISPAGHIAWMQYDSTRKADY